MGNPDTCVNILKRNPPSSDYGLFEKEGFIDAFSWQTSQRGMPKMQRFGLCVFGGFACPDDGTPISRQETTRGIVVCLEPFIPHGKSLKLPPKN